MDRIPPEVTLKGNRSIQIDRWQETSYAVSFDSGATAQDNHGLEITKIDTTSSYFTGYRNVGYVTGVFEITYVAVDSAGNQSTETRYVNVQQPPTGIDAESVDKQSLEVFPNPTEGRFSVNVKLDAAKHGKLVIQNSLGKTIEVLNRGTISSGSYQADLNNSKAGIYFIKLQSEDSTIVKRIVLQ